MDIGSGALLADKLLRADRAIRVGAIHRIDFESATVLTHDRWKYDAGGIAKHSFLLATASNVNGNEEDDDEVILLRVQRTAPLSLDRDLLAVREESLRNALSAKGDDPNPAVEIKPEMDPFTASRMAFAGLECKILGTFFEDVVDGQSHISFGADVDNVYSTNTYRVLKPTNDGLSFIASFLKVSSKNSQLVNLGHVRFSATTKRAVAAKQDSAVVKVDINDFIGHKTGLLGMTRTGKSNTAKILVAETFKVSARRAAEDMAPIGQLIFDPQGEYANPNEQDKTEIAAIGGEYVSIYKMGATPDDVGVRPLGINFLDPEQVSLVQSLIIDELVNSGVSAAGYVQDFGSAEFDDSGDRSQISHAGRGRLALYAALKKAGFLARPQHTIRFSIGAALIEKVNEKAGEVVIGQAGSGHGSVEYVNLEKAAEAIVALRKGEGDQEGPPKKGTFTDFCKGVQWGAAEPILTGQSLGRSVRGWKVLQKLRVFHDPNASDVAKDIYDDLLDGKIVIVDLHIGNSQVTERLSKMIAGHIVAEQTKVFTSGQEAPPIQLMLEEAHNLFSSENYKNEADVWVRLAKEGSKLNIGMAYATQEVSGVAHQVKANTANWVVAHLNNTKEIQELSRFYDFKEFGDSIVASEDRGFVRLKTLSSPYIVPVQIKKYDAEIVESAKEVASGARPGGE